MIRLWWTKAENWRGNYLPAALTPSSPCPWDANSEQARLQRNKIHHLAHLATQSVSIPEKLPEKQAQVARSLPKNQTAQSWQKPLVQQRRLWGVYRHRFFCSISTPRGGATRAAFNLGARQPHRHRFCLSCSVFNARQHSQRRLSPSSHQLGPCLKERSRSVEWIVVKDPILTPIEVQGGLFTSSSTLESGWWGSGQH